MCNECPQVTNNHIPCCISSHGRDRLLPLSREQVMTQHGLEMWIFLPWQSHFFRRATRLTLTCCRVVCRRVPPLHQLLWCLGHPPLLHRFQHSQQLVVWKRPPAVHHQVRGARYCPWKTGSLATIRGRRQQMVGECNQTECLSSLLSHADLISLPGSITVEGGRTIRKQQADGK